MRNLKYTGVGPYDDPRLRFVAEKGDVIEFTDDEADAMRKQHPRTFQEVKSDADIGVSGGSVSPDDSGGNGVC